MLARRTHYERALRRVRNMDAARSWARSAIAEPEPVLTLTRFMQQKLDGARDVEAAATFLGTEMVGYVHALIVELLRHERRSFSTLTDETIWFGDLMAVVAGADQMAMNTAGQMIYQMVSHELEGKRVYEVTEGLADKLLHMELRGLTTDDLVLPEHSIYIMVPLDAGLRVYNEDTGWHRCEGIYVTLDHEDDGTRCWRFLAVGESKPIEIGGIPFDNDAIVYWRVPLPPGMELDAAIKNAHSHMVRDTVAHDSPFRGMWDEWARIFAFCMNTVIYTTWPECERENVYANTEAKKLWEKVQRHPAKSKKRAKAQRQLSALDPMRRTVLGRSIIIDRSREAGDGATGNGRPLTKRVRVHGHWKRQAYGPGFSERRLILIEPYWKGPVDGEVSEARHRLK